MNKFEQVSSDHHQISLAGGRSSGLMSGRGRSPGLMWGGGEWKEKGLGLGVMSGGIGPRCDVWGNGSQI